MTTSPELLGQGDRSRSVVARLGLGSVQFGLDYGVANRAGRPGLETVERCLRLAADAGLTLVDTAPRYGEAERVLGAAEVGRGPLRVVTKTVAARPDEDPERRVVAGLERSLAALGLERVHGLLEHRPAELLGPRAGATWRGLVSAFERGLTAGVGVSVTEPEQLDRLLDRYPLHLVQLPFNVLDRRFLSPERAARLVQLGIEVHARSAFLQGALLGELADVAHVPGLATAVERFQRRCAEVGVEPIVGALSVALAHPAVDVVLVGVQDEHQLARCLAAAEAATAVDPEPFRELSIADVDRVDPSRWPERVS